jgi:thiol-disulfide isomerase/thioredoxin
LLFSSEKNDLTNGVSRLNSHILSQLKTILMKKLNVLFILLSTLTTLSAQGIAFESAETTWADILKKAKAENKIVFVDAFTTWCGPCKAMSNTIFPLKEVGDVFNARFVNAKIDMEKGEGPTIAQKYGVQAYPTYLFVNGDGELVHRSLGGMPAEKFIAVGESASDPERQFFSLKKKYEGGEKSPNFLKKFATACQEAQETALIQPVADAYLATQKDWLTKENMEFIVTFTTGIESPNFTFMVKNQAAFEEKIGDSGIKKLIYQTAFRDIAQKSYLRAKREFDMDKAKDLGAKHLSPALLDQVISGMTMAQHEMKNETPQLLAHVIVHMDKYPSDDAQQLNQYAWTFYEKSDDKAQLAKALEWSLKSVQISDEYAFNDTAASLYFKIGNKQKAKEYAEKAIKQAKETNFDSADTEALLKRIEAM